MIALDSSFGKYYDVPTCTTGKGNYIKDIMDKSKEKSLVNFKKAQSHIKKIIQMIENGDYCIDIMQQNLAVIGLLKSAHQLLMEGHLNSCFSKAMETNNQAKKRKMIEEILKVSKMASK